jgi:hypothetical protein
MVAGHAPGTPSELIIFFTSEPVTTPAAARKRALVQVVPERGKVASTTSLNREG